VLVYGDVNSTVAAALVAAKLGIKVGHVEAGLRSRDRTMPEEINRMVTDQISDLFFTPSNDGDENLKRENISADRIFMVGNLMIDTLVRLLPQAQRPDLLELKERFVLVTLHRPSNVDDPVQIEKLMSALTEISRTVQVIFPVHPRTRRRLGQLRVEDVGFRLLLAEPLGYLEFLWLQQHAAVVVTDSGGIQEETTYLGVPCLTMRENTERPVTVDVGTNKLIGKDTELLKKEVEHVLEGRAKKGTIPPLWDGKAGERLVEVLLKLHTGKQKTES
jgi:UDP-N-acetylglucosamine 2-epimerase (non-hydrolysing)